MLAVGPGRISQNTLDFLKLLAVPANNDRDWYVFLADLSVLPESTRLT